MERLARQGMVCQEAGWYRGSIEPVPDRGTGFLF